MRNYQPIDFDSAGRLRRLVNGSRRETRCDMCGEWTGNIGAHRGGKQCASDSEARELTEAGYVRIPVVKGAVEAVRRVAGEPCEYLTGYESGGPGRRSRRTRQRWTWLPAGWEMGPDGPRPLAMYEAPEAMPYGHPRACHWVHFTTHPRVRYYLL